MLQLERKLFRTWCDYVFRGGWGSASANSSRVWTRSTQALAKTRGPWFLESQGPGIVDLQYVSHVERMAASVAYWKGDTLRGGRWKHIDTWFEAFEQRPSYCASRSDWYTHANDIPPQYGNGVDDGSKEQQTIRMALDGGDAAWRLPLPPLSSSDAPSDVLQPGWGAFEADAPYEAAYHVLENLENVARFAARGAGKEGGWSFMRPDRARLADPYAKPAEGVVLEKVQEALLVVGACLVGNCDTSVDVSSLKALDESMRNDIRASLAYVRDRVGVPRDMSYPAARCLRGALNWLTGLRSPRVELMSNIPAASASPRAVMRLRVVQTRRTIAAASGSIFSCVKACGLNPFWSSQHARRRAADGNWKCARSPELVSEWFQAGKPVQTRRKSSFRPHDRRAWHRSRDRTPSIYMCLAPRATGERRPRRPSDWGGDAKLHASRGGATRCPRTRSASLTRGVTGLPTPSFSTCSIYPDIVRHSHPREGHRSGPQVEADAADEKIGPTLDPSSSPTSRSGRRERGRPSRRTRPVARPRPWHTTSHSYWLSVADKFSRPRVRPERPIRIAIALPRTQRPELPGQDTQRPTLLHTTSSRSRLRGDTTLQAGCAVTGSRWAAPSPWQPQASLSRGSTLCLQREPRRARRVGGGGVERGMGRHRGRARQRARRERRGRLGNRGRELVREGAAPYVDDAARPGAPALARRGSCGRGRGRKARVQSRGHQPGSWCLRLSPYKSRTCARP